MSIATPILNEISGALSSLAGQVQSQFPDYPSLAEHWNWQQPGITKYDFFDRVNKTISTINNIGDVEIDESMHNRLSRVPATINYINGNTVPNMQGQNFHFGYVAIVAMLEAIEDLVEPLQPKEPNWQEIQDRKLFPANLKKRLDNVQRGISNVENQFSGLSDKISLINEAHQAADALPASLAGLEEARSNFEEARSVIFKIRIEAETALSEIEGYKEQVERNLFKSKELTGNIDEVYSAATRQGLGKAFQERADALKVSTYVLMAILAFILAVAGVISHQRISFVEGLLSNPNLSLQLLWANVLLTVVGVAAPIWFAWLLTKQISQRFRLVD